MHWFARVVIGLIIMAVGLAIIAYAPKLTDRFDQPATYTGYFRIAGMVAIVVGVLFVFGVLGGTTAVTELSLGETT